MARVLTCCIMFFAACLPVLAQGDVAANAQLPDSNVVHWIITLGGTLWAALLASRAFNRPAILDRRRSNCAYVYDQSQPISVGQFDLRNLRLRIFPAARSVASGCSRNIRLGPTSRDHPQGSSPGDQRSIRVLPGHRWCYGCHIPLAGCLNSFYRFDKWSLCRG